ncbi:MAG: hypothetical protein LJE70_12460, partial [Chromatiaceae bacterium]|nr:hypothetical protein [Chromatiaceae bacterium]
MNHYVIETPIDLSYVVQPYACINEQIHLQIVDNILLWRTASRCATRRPAFFSFSDFHMNMLRAFRTLVSLNSQNIPYIDLVTHLDI